MPGSNGQLAELQSQLQFLQQEYTKSVTERNRLYGIGNDANSAVAFARQNVEAAVNRYRQEMATVDSATQNLEKARSEEALARLANEELIASYTNGLPYAVIPNGNGATNAGTPRGNNPSGSPLGPVPQGGDGAPGSFVISSWTNYLSQAYGASVNPAFRGSVTALYPFTFSSIVRGNSVTNLRGDGSGSGNGNGGWNGGSGSGSGNGNGNGVWTGGCSGATGTGGIILPSVSTTGTITSVRDTSFDLRLNDGSVVTVNVAPCTTLNSNKQNYQITSGDVAVVKAIQQSSSVYGGQSVTCLSEA